MAVLNELDLIAAIRRRSTGTHRGIALGIGDDCAILRPPAGHEILVTTDFTLEDRHFRRDTHAPESAGHRTLARGLSDLAAMGAKPLAAFLSLALPKPLLATAKGRHWLDRYLDGLHTLAARSGVTLAGGDTSESPSPQILADIVLLGTAPRGRALRRATAQPCDAIYVTGALGGAAAELQTLLAKPTTRYQPGAHPQLFPKPRLAVGQALLRRRIATACIDLSDGLSTDLTHLCEASGVCAEIASAALPLHPLAKGSLDALSLALNGGEDYELLFTASPKTKVPGSIAGVAITRIGTIRAAAPNQPTLTLIEPDGRSRTLPPAGWQHFTR